VTSTKQPTQNMLSNRELARFVRRFAALYDHDGDQNAIVHRSLMKLASDLAKSEAKTILGVADKNKEVDRRKDAERYKDPTLSVSDVRRLIADEAATKRDLINLASTRFGIPRGRLNRSSIDEVFEIISSSADHEESLDIISKNAATAGKARHS